MIHNTNYYFSQAYLYTSPVTMSSYEVTITDYRGNIIPVTPVITPTIPATAVSFNVEYSIQLSAGVYNVGTIYETSSTTSPIVVLNDLVAVTWTDIEGNYLSKTGVSLNNDKIAQLILSLQSLLPCFDYTQFSLVFDRIALDEGLTLLLAAQNENADPTNPRTPLIGYSQGDTVYKYSPLFRGDFPESKASVYQKEAQKVLSRFPCFKEFYEAQKFYSLTPTTGGLDWCTGGTEFA